MAVTFNCLRFKINLLFFLYEVYRLVDGEYILQAGNKIWMPKFDIAPIKLILIKSYGEVLFNSIEFSALTVTFPLLPVPKFSVLIVPPSLMSNKIE